MMSMSYIRKTYGVPAKRGGRVIYENRFSGTIVGSSDAYLRIRLDDPPDGEIFLYHPDYALTYLPDMTRI